MALGDSGGRSAGNRNGQGARRRATPRERAGIDPPLDQMVAAHPEERPRVDEKLFTGLSWASLFMLLALGIFLLGVWFGAWAL